MAVPVRLDDRDDRGRHAAGLTREMALDRSEIFLQRLQVDARRGVSPQ
jgi:hypothetical protein